LPKPDESTFLKIVATLFAFYNIYNILEIKTKREGIPVLVGGAKFINIADLLRMILTFTLAVFGWILFRADSMNQAVDYFAHIFNGGFLSGTKILATQELLLCLVLIIIEWLQRDKQHAYQFGDSKLFSYRIVRWGVYYITLLAIAFFAGASQTFIYFQF
jgi:hypothetical protein